MRVRVREGGREGVAAAAAAAAAVAAAEEAAVAGVADMVRLMGGLLRPEAFALGPH